MNTDFTHVFALPGALHCIDAVHPETGLTLVHRQTLAEVQARHPGAELVPWEVMGQRRRAHYTQGPAEITKERWWYLLEVLPPMNWRNRGHTESFMLSEFDTDDITCCCVRIGTRYWSCHQPDSTTHDQLVQLVRAAFPDA